jgi:molybdopterin/thiamine biosynthesis adenylyltransferase
MLLEMFRSLNIYQIGCGGTGSWLVYPICKFLRNLVTRYDNINLTYTLVDDDIVEARNILRQNFEEYDIDRNKATTMVRKYSNVYPLMEAIKIRIDTPKKLQNLLEGEYHSNPHMSIPYTDSPRELIIILGCVDSNKTRRMAYRFFTKKYNRLTTPVTYIDSGNNLHNGQIVTCYFEKLSISPYINSERHKNPNMVKMFPLKADEDDQSCAFFGDQSQSINMLASSFIFSNFQKLIIDRLLPPPIINFNSSGFSYFEKG